MSTQNVPQAHKPAINYPLATIDNCVVERFVLQKQNEACDLHEIENDRAAIQN